MFQIPMTERQYAWIFVMGSLVLQIVPAIILYVSIQRLRTLIKEFDTSQFMAKERLMKIHTLLYACSICSIFVSISTQQWSLENFNN